MVAEWSNVRPESRSPKWLVFVLCVIEILVCWLCAVTSKCRPIGSCPTV